MKKNMKKSIIVFGAVLTVILMVSSATAALQHIDSNIKITKLYEKKLTNAYNVADGDFKILIGEIIELLKTKNVVDSNDIKNIIDENYLSISRVYLARYASTNAIVSPGSCGPHALRPFYWGGPFYWSADTAAHYPTLPITVEIGSNAYPNNHKGFIVSYFGFATNAGGFYGGRVQNKFMFGGIGFLIFISE